MNGPSGGGSGSPRNINRRIAASSPGGVGGDRFSGFDSPGSGRAGSQSSSHLASSGGGQTPRRASMNSSVIQGQMSMLNGGVGGMEGNIGGGGGGGNRASTGTMGYGPPMTNSSSASVNSSSGGGYNNTYGNSENTPSTASSSTTAASSQPGKKKPTLVRKISSFFSFRGKSKTAEVPGGDPSMPKIRYNEKDCNKLIKMGFSKDMAVQALIENNHNLALATEALIGNY